MLVLLMGSFLLDYCQQERVCCNKVGVNGFVHDLICVSLKGVSKYYRHEGQPHSIIAGVTFEVGAGQSCAIIGQSGSGKSTLLNIIGLLDFVDAGEYVFMGRPVAKARSDELATLRKMTMGFVFQHFNLIPRLNVIENVALPLRYRGLDRACSLKRAMSELQRVGMAHRASYKPAELSGGQKQRVAIARALVGQPSLILADEPTGSLDSQSSGDILDLLLSIQKEQGVTLLIVTHDMSVAQRMQRQFVVHNGLVEELQA
ncbi:ABC transporter ATP-binding protein [Pseudomonas fragi]|uniref:ABC transporter ATP-binding protein n=1 Tax=Pseudomonas fragi TaxID=296 RepID=UPI0028ED0C47|nr:ABC transporter ATP-binding protein [Pseudomonas fragi]